MTSSSFDSLGRLSLQQSFPAINPQMHQSRIFCQAADQISDISDKAKEGSKAICAQVADE